MKNDLQSTIEQVAKFLNKTVTEVQMRKLLEHLNFDSMKNNTAVNYENTRNTTLKFMRKGVVGDYRNLMSEETIEKFDVWISKNDKGVFQKL